MRPTNRIDECLRRYREASQPPSFHIGALLNEMKNDSGSMCTYTHIFDRAARTQSQQLDHRCTARRPEPQLPLFGIPVAIKDNIDIADTATSCGSIVLNRPLALSDSTIVRRLKDAGAVVLGKTNLDEAALGASGRNEHFGRCRNPRRADALSGGSSSGSAAAVAAEHVLLAVGTDTLGSARIPAALCGVAGFKPSHGRIDTRGVAPLYPAYDTIGLVAAGLEELEQTARALQLGSLNERAHDHIGTIWVLSDAHLADVDVTISTAYRHRVHALNASRTVRLRELPAFDFAVVSRAALWEVASHFALGIGFSEASFDAKRELLGAELLQLLRRAATLSSGKIQAGREILRAARSDLHDYLAQADAIFTPTCPVSGIPAAAPVPKTIAAFVAAANVAGLPAVCWPETLSATQNVSWQLIGRPGEDLAVLRLAAQIARLD